jgi:hypothetical protein
MTMERKAETILCIVFVLLFVGLGAFLFIVQPKTDGQIDMSQLVDVGQTLDSAIIHSGSPTVKMTLVSVDYHATTAELTFRIQNDTDQAIRLVSDYVSCFTDKALLHGRLAGDTRYLSVDAHTTETWHVFVDGADEDMIVCYMDIPQELVFASWKVIRNDT